MLRNFTQKLESVLLRLFGLRQESAFGESAFVQVDNRLPLVFKVDYVQPADESRIYWETPRNWLIIAVRKRVHGTAPQDTFSCVLDVGLTELQTQDTGPGRAEWRRRTPTRGTFNWAPSNPKRAADKTGLATELDAQKADRGPSPCAAAMVSTTSSLTDIPVLPDEPSQLQDDPSGTPSAIPEDKEDGLTASLEDDWQDDPDNPRRWPSGKKWTSSVIYHGPRAARDRRQVQDYERHRASHDLSIFLISFGIARCRSVISLRYSEVREELINSVGDVRTPVLNLGNLITIAFSLGCAFAPTSGTLLAFRFLAGASGSAPLACGGGVIGDLFSERDRAAAMALYNLGPLIGPGNPYAFVLLRSSALLWEASKLESLHNGLLILAGKHMLPSSDSKKSKIPPPREGGEKPPHPHQGLEQAPLPNMEQFEPAGKFAVWQCRLFSIEFVHGLPSTSRFISPTQFSDIYGFNTGTGGLAYIGLGLGFMLVGEERGKGEPEMRIPALIFGSLFVPVGFWYGWSAEAKLHWIMPIIGSGIFGFGSSANKRKPITFSDIPRGRHDEHLVLPNYLPDLSPVF
ncbi:hypothetical protein DFH06DRAFT_1149316 [Mycena polygramma]|nr:hypothetical protein DFH06DRAFT_1149316 [Mycena polygramma]